jgi:hypothetical protein
MEELQCDAWQAVEAVTDVLEHCRAGAPSLCPLLGHYRSAASYKWTGLRRETLLLSLPGLTEYH